MLPPAVKTITKDEKDKTADTLTLAFVDDPVMRWIMPEASAYLKNVGRVNSRSAGARWNTARVIASTISRRPRSGCRRASAPTRR